MTGEPADSAVLDTGGMSPAALASLGESVLGRALQRRQADADRPGPGCLIAAFDDCI